MIKLDASTCRFCHQAVLWTTLPSGKRAPLDPGLRYVLPPNPSAELEEDPTPLISKVSLILASTGELMRGVEAEAPPPPDALLGYVNHWITCPKHKEVRAAYDPPKPPWREGLRDARTQKCDACGGTGPHLARCTPWVSHWGEVRCATCDRHLRWLPRPPESDQGAWAKAKIALARYEAITALEAYLDALGLRWRHDPRGLRVTGVVDGGPATLSDEEKAHLRQLTARVREVHGWPDDAWKWSEVEGPRYEGGIFAPPQDPLPLLPDQEQGRAA